MSFEDRKWITDWHGIMGINHICPHLSLYSMKGERKRDYPPTLSPQQPWWKYNKTMEDYIGRICYINTLGQQQADILVMSPLESTYIEMDVINPRPDRSRDGRYNRFLRDLMGQHVDFDIGDEQILKDIAVVRENRLVVGEMKYKAIILPYMLTIRSSTIELIKEMKKMGMNIYMVGDIPTFIDGERDQNRIEKILQSAIALDPKDVLGDLEEDLDKSLTISGRNLNVLWKNRRIVDIETIYQLSNTSRLETLSCSMLVQGDPVTLWDPASGVSITLDSKSQLTFAPTQTWIISMYENSSVEIISEREENTRKAQEIILPNSWKGKRIDENSLTLDFASYSKGQNGDYSNPEPIIGIHSRLTKNQYNGLLTLKFGFKVKDIPQNCSLVLEQPEMYQGVQVNGKKIEFVGNKSYRDHTFKMQTINGTLKEGENTITLVLDYVAPVLDSFDPYERYGTEIESIYLVGDFGISFDKSVPTDDFVTEKNGRRKFKQQDIYRVNDFWITTEQNEFEGRLTTEGYPFYNGDFELTQNVTIDKIEEGKKYFLVFDEIETTVLSAFVNGKAIDPIAWNPWKIDITNAIITGENRISLKLTNSLRNLLGPHHHVGGELIGVGPGSFTGITFWTSRLEGENDWYDRRITGNAALWVDDYFLIPFGVEDVKILVE